MQTYLNILKYPEHRYETLFFCARTWHTLMHTMKRSLKHSETIPGELWVILRHGFPMFSVSFPLHGDPWQSDTCMDSKISADCLRYSFGGVHLSISIRPWPRQSQIKRKPDESYLLLPHHFLWTGLGYGQILLSTYGKSIGTHVAVGPHTLVADVQVPPSAVGPKLLKTSRARPKPPWLSSRLLRCHCYGQKTIWIELVHTHICMYHCAIIICTILVCIN